MRSVICAAAMLAAVPAYGQFVDEDELALVESVAVYVDDGVKDGCLPQPNVLKIEAELILRRSAVEVAPGAAAAVIEIVVTGAEHITNWCAVGLRVELYRHARQMEGHSALVVSYRDSGLAGAPKSRMQAHLRERVSLYVTDLANEILKARQGQ
jgi:hypothetical protein